MHCQRSYFLKIFYTIYILKHTISVVLIKHSILYPPKVKMDFTLFLLFSPSIYSIFFFPGCGYICLPQSVSFELKICHIIPVFSDVFLEFLFFQQVLLEFTS